MIQDNGQAGATSGGPNGKEPIGFCFHTQNDALDYANHLVKSSRGRLPLKYLDLANNYRGNGCNIRLKATIWGTPVYFKFASSSVPVQSSQFSGGDVDALFRIDIQNEPLAVGQNINNPLMLIGSGDAPYRPEFAVPSVIWLEIPDEGDDIRTYALAPFFDFTVQVLDISSHGEMDLAYIAETQQEGRVASRLIKSISEMCHNPISGKPQPDREALLKFYACDALASIIVKARYNSVWAVLSKELAFPFELQEAFFSALDE